MKKGLSDIVTTLLIILISLVAIGVISLVVFNLIGDSSESVDINKLTLGLDILDEKTVLDNIGRKVSISVKRDFGQGELKNIRVVVYDESSSYYEDFPSIGELETKKFEIDYGGKLNGDPKKVAIFPVFADGELGDKADEQELVGVDGEIIDDEAIPQLEEINCELGNILCVDIMEDKEYSTIQDAIDASLEGDRIYIFPGTYYESLEIINKRNISLIGVDEDNPPILDGADPNFNPQWEHVEGKIYKTDYDFYRPLVTDDEFTELHGGSALNRVPMQVYEDEEFLRGSRNKKDPDFPTQYNVAGHYTTLDQLDPSLDEPETLPSTKDIQIPGRFLYNESAKELYVWPADEDHPSNHEYKIPNTLRLIYIWRSNDTLIKNLVITHSEGYAVYYLSSNNAVFENNYLVNNLYPLLTSNVNNFTVRNNFVQINGFWERMWYEDAKSTILWTHQIDINGGSNTNIYRNLVTKSYGNVRLDTNDAMLHDNLISRAMSINLNLGQYNFSKPANLTVYNNIVHTVDDNSVGLSNSAMNGTYIYRNLFYNIKYLTKEGSNVPIKGNEVYFYNNIFAFMTRLIHHPYYYPVYGGNIYRNNIIYSGAGGSEEYYWGYIKNEADWDFTPFVDGPDTDNNLFWERYGERDPPSMIAYFYYDGGAHYLYRFDEFAKMQDEIGIEQNGLQEDPLFVNREEFKIVNPRPELTYDSLSDRDYREVVGNFDQIFDEEFSKIMSKFELEQNSPAVDRGEVLPEAWPDYVEYSGSAPDIGIREI